MNRIDQLFGKKNENILSIYFTAGHPSSDSTVDIIKVLADAGADMIEIGIPFSDPMADGPVIQQSSAAALKNGMSLKKLFQQLQGIRNHVDIPLLLMGYLNPVLQFGMEDFCKNCTDTGIDGMILPDLPLDVYAEQYRHLPDKYHLYNIFLVSPQTGDERIRMIDESSRGFIYMVSASSTTGVKGSFSETQMEYFKRIQSMSLKNPVLIGFGISDRSTFGTACKYAQGAIIGSAFVNMLSGSEDLKKDIDRFIRKIRE
ncbi:MAG: tryptophan synthase subunit alpha [Bacteroidales bacterium]|nr:tryptophan synthase subunit alpha [Bacteroidales bacterium]